MPDADTPTREWMRFAHELADLARPIARQYFRRPLAVESKSDASPVTIADRRIEQAMRAAIGERFPAHAVLGEEFGEQGDGALRWVLDPIDGTRSFICGVPLFGTLIALLDRGRPLLGIIDMPMLDERWAAGPDHPTTWNGAPARTSACAELSAAKLFSTAPDLFAGDDARRIAPVESAVAVRRFGGDCYQYGLLASGQIDLVIEAGLQRYDVMALVPIIESAGGRICGWDGAPLSERFDGRVVAAANEALLAQTLARLA
ncbi:MAG: histidinol-phosphatase [Burkholderiaceae bacterium]